MEEERKSKIAAGLLGIFLGTYGVHNFYLGYTTKAIIQVAVGGGATILVLLLSWIGIGLIFVPVIWGISIWGLVEGIMILAGGIKVDGKGVPLKE